VLVIVDGQMGCTQGNEIELGRLRLLFEVWRCFPPTSRSLEGDASWCAAGRNRYHNAHAVVHSLGNGQSLEAHGQQAVRRPILQDHGEAAQTPRARTGGNSAPRRRPESSLDTINTNLY
jgi:hypothetical protein